MAQALPPRTKLPEDKLAQPSLEEARMVFEVRRCLEAEVVRLVIARWKPEMGKALESHVREEKAAASAGQLTASIRLAGEFHIKLARMSGNPLLADHDGDGRPTPLIQGVPSI